MTQPKTVHRGIVLALNPVTGAASVRDIFEHTNSKQSMVRLMKRVLVGSGCPGDAVQLEVWDVQRDELIYKRRWVIPVKYEG